MKIDTDGMLQRLFQAEHWFQPRSSTNKGQ